MLLQVQDPVLLDLYASLLSPEEQQHVKAATSQAARKERLLARALQRSVLSRSAATSVAPVVNSQEVLERSGNLASTHNGILSCHHHCKGRLNRKPCLAKQGFLWLLDACRPAAL